MSRAQQVALALALFALLLGIGSMDYKDERAEEREYCKRVAAGDWPDYKQLKAECRKWTR